MTAVSPQVIAAAIDIGSNSIKMTIGRADGEGGIEQLDWASEVVRLGQGLDRTGLLDEERIEFAIETLKLFTAQARERGAERIVAVATEATRAAGNGASFLDRVRKETGIDVRVVDGQEEAALTFRGVLAGTDLTGSVVVADIGGGSTELISAHDGEVQMVRSLPLGSGRMTDRFVVADPPQSDEIAACETEAGAVVQALPPLGLVDRLIVVGGTGEYMARLMAEDQQIDLQAVRIVISKLLTLSAAEVADEIEIPEARARVLPAGVAIVASIASNLHPSWIEISRSGIRTGLLMEAVYGDDSSSADDPAKIAGTAEKRGYKVEGPATDQLNAADSSFRETMRALIGERWRIVWEAIPVALEGTSIEGVHDVRVASRRLRAAMDVAEPAFPQKWYKRLHQTAKEITGALGEVRDRDVLLEALRADRSAAPAAEHPGIDRLIDRVEHERVAARADMERFLRQLLDGPLPCELERRFGNAHVSTTAPDSVEGRAS
jgi:Ppx/GppA phosphatase family/CHAD domain